MEEVAPLGIGGALEHYHQILDIHFSALAEERRRGGDNAPVFALEHGLDSARLAALKDAVRAAVAQGFPLRFRKWWLPFVVYAAELGYQYSGGEYWHTFEDETPRWDEVGDRGWVRSQFIKFADRYGGVRPIGKFADHFPIIAWPITHAVLPIYLQRNLAQLLYDFRGGLAGDLLQNPEALGERLAARVDDYTERFQIFCQNTSLLGSVAIALLGEGSDSPYLLPSTQLRIVEDLSTEQDSRRWLTSARQSASSIRAKGFARSVNGSEANQASASAGVTPPRVDPKLRLRLRDGQWQLWGLLPDLTPLKMSLGDLSDEIRGRNALVQGIDGMLPTDMHLRAGQMKRLNRWPDPSAPFLQLKGASDEVNALIATLCGITLGPAWLFGMRDPDLADQLKGRVIRPGRRYVLVQNASAPDLDLSWQQHVALEVAGMRASYLNVPQQLSDSDRFALTEAGLVVVTDLIVQPVGLVPSSWDGEGEMEWLAGEPAVIRIVSGIAPLRCELVLDDNTYHIDWPADRGEIFLQFGDIAVGRHEMGVRLIAKNEHVIATETLFVTIRDPQVRPETATAAEGIRMFASPSRPTMADLWNGPAFVTIEGPTETVARIRVRLLSELGEQLAQKDFPVDLPVTEADWPAIAEKIRNHSPFGVIYDEAESVEMGISQEGIGFATLTCDRGFQPLRWKIHKNNHENRFTARLVDRTDGTATRIELFTVDNPLMPVGIPCEPAVAVPPLGGLLRATSGGFQQTVILPTQPTEMLRAGRLQPDIHVIGGTKQEMVLHLAEGYRMWKRAELPGSVFAQAMRDRVLNAIAFKVIMLISGGKWASTERKVMDSDEPRDRLDELQAAVGADQRHVKLAGKIVRSLWEWKAPAVLIRGFHGLITPEVDHYGVSFVPTAFLLHLADLGNSLDDILDWDSDDYNKILTAVIQTPVLVRAARLAVLGARLFIDPDEAAKGF